MKVLIADDEEKICQLIKNLVNWEEMDMEVLACVNDGIAALKVIKEEKPELVITDIRMPGHDGLEIIKESRVLSPETEFIIISGYRHFEYAQNAIRYGVKNYLLKPVKKIELNDELDKIRKNYYLRVKNEEDNIKTMFLMEQNKEKVRVSFLQELLFKDYLRLSPLNMAEINEKYQYGFQEGIFQVAIVKIDGLDLTAKKETEYIHDKLERLVAKILGGLCLEMEYLWLDNFCYLLLNYGDDNFKDVRHALKSLLDNLLLQKEVLNNIYITIGLGEIRDSVTGIFQSAKIARRAVEQRLFEGVNRLLEGQNWEKSQIPFSRMFEEFNKVFIRGIEGLSESEIVSALQNLKQDMINGERQITGYEVLQMAKEVMNQFLFLLKKQSFSMQQSYDQTVQMEPGCESGTSMIQSGDLAGPFSFDTFSRNIENQGSFDDVMNYLKGQVLELYVIYKTTCLSEENRPIREVKRFIREHYQRGITLEMAGSQIGFNATYLSTLFKREAGYTFSEYLTQVRMEKAKELLRETDHNISVICENVGYSDLKNFTKNFKNYTGLRPNEYRKIYG